MRSAPRATRAIVAAITCALLWAAGEAAALAANAPPQPAAAVTSLLESVTVDVSVPGSPVQPGPVTASVTLTPNPGGGILDAKWCELCGTFATVPVDADGTTDVPLGPVPVGSYTLHIDYGGFEEFLPSTGSTTFQVVASSTTSLAVDRSTAYQGEIPVALTATVSSVEDVTGGTVTFFDNVGGSVVQLGPVPVDPTTHKAVYASSQLRLGSHSVTAKFNGQEFIAASTSAAKTFSVLADTAVHATFITPAGAFYPYPDGYRDTIKFSGILSEKATVTVRIYNAGGSLVKTFSLGTKNPGAWSVLWGGRNASGAKVPAGTYTARVTFKDVKNHTKTINGKTVVSWRRAVWRSVSVTRYADTGQYVVSDSGGFVYQSLDYARGRVLDAFDDTTSCPNPFECGFAAGRFAIQLRTTGVLAYRTLHLEGRGHGFSDRDHTGTLYLEHPTTEDFVEPMSLPLFDEAGVTYGIPFTTALLSPTKLLVAWVWMDQYWGDAYDLNYLRLTYEYATWAS
jgi:flagellar hook assembly protein FlgD